jgi:all-trans-retinol 13,14-reductase
VDGGSQIAIALSRKIRAQGGIIRKRCEVVNAIYQIDKKTCEAVVLASGETIYGKQFISNLHPLPTMSIFGEEHFLKPFRKRIQQLPNSLSCFMVHLVFKENKFPYLNYNIYKHHNEDVWAGSEYSEVTWPEQYFISTPITSRNKEFAESMSIMCYMRYEEVMEWKDSFNTRTTPHHRPNDYEEFKKKKESQVVNRLVSLFPTIKEQIHSIYSCTPLSWRDYLQTPQGSMYGISKDAHQPLKSMVNAKTHVPNLYLTGQNLIMHGILGVCIGALITCSHFIDRKKLLTQIALSNQV